MPILDFKEIPEAHKSSGLQDTFELFARDVLSLMGYIIITEPDRGADGGVDLIIEEKRIGVGGETIIRWLVSCKHQAFSGKSVSPTVESNLRDRIETHECDGFIGFYSTLPSSGLSTNLEGMKDKFDYQIFDKEKIEKELLHSSDGLQIAKRYFPKSLNKWKTENPKPAKLFIDNPSLKCKVCKKELLTNDYGNLISVWKKLDDNGVEHIEHIFWTCKGYCDGKISSTIDDELINGWEDISDIMIPTTFIRWIMSTLNEHRNGVVYSDEAFKNLKEFILQVFPHISRELTTKEKERLSLLSMIPSYLGGHG